MALRVTLNVDERTTLDFDNAVSWYINEYENLVLRDDETLLIAEFNRDHWLYVVKV